MVNHICEPISSNQFASCSSARVGQGGGGAPLTVNRLPLTIEWLSDNGSCYLAGKTRSFARDIGLDPRTTPIESPQSNGMAEAFVRTIKRDYVRVSPCAEADTVMHQLSA